MARKKTGRKITINIVKIGQENQVGTTARLAREKAYHLSGERVHFEEKVYRLNALNDETLSSSLSEDLEKADILLGGGIFEPDHVEVLMAFFKKRRPDVVMLAPARRDISAYARLGDFDGLQIPVENVFGTVRQLLIEKGAFSPDPVPLYGPNSSVLPTVSAGIHAYAVALLFFSNWSEENAPHFLLHLANHCRKLIEAGVKLEVASPVIYPEGGFWHPAEQERYFKGYPAYQGWYASYWKARYGSLEPVGRVLISVFRSHLTSGNHVHYAATIAALEKEGLAVVARFGESPDPEAPGGLLTVTDPFDLILNLTGFNLLGQHGQPHIEAQNRLLSEKNWTLFTPVPLFWQSLTDWGRNRMGLNPGQLALQVAVPEMEGALFPAVFAGKSGRDEKMRPNLGQVKRIARSVYRRVALNKKPCSERRVAVVLFGFPPDRGALGTASGLDVYASLFNLLKALKQQGYLVELPGSAAELKELFQAAHDPANIAGGHPGINLAARFNYLDYERLFPDFRRIEKQWGISPGESGVQAGSFLIHGREFGNIFIGAQPSFGSAGDPLQMLFRPDAAPPHSYAAYYTWLHRVWGADVLIHFGTHGSLEFLPGKQAGPTIRNYSDLLTGDIPHLYYYAVNDPSEAAIAKRRSYALTISYLTPPVQQAGLYKHLADIHEQVHFFLNTSVESRREQIWQQIENLIGEVALDREIPLLAMETGADREEYLTVLHRYLTDLEEELIPVGLHVGGAAPELSEIADLAWAALQYDRTSRGFRNLPSILASAKGLDWLALLPGTLERDPILKAGKDLVVNTLQLGKEDALAILEQDSFSVVDRVELDKALDYILELAAKLREDAEIEALLKALNGGFIPPTPGGDPLREVEVIPTGRNIQTLNPYRLPSPAAVQLARPTIDRLLARAGQENGWPEAVAMVMWGNETIKTGGEDIAQALYLLGVEAQEDASGRMTALRLIPLVELGRPRIDVTLSISGIFRDVLPAGAELLDRAVRLAAEADEPVEQNFVRKHTLELVASQGIDFEEATARVFSNSPGEYGSGVNRLVENSEWEKSEELGDRFVNRMSYAYGKRRQGRAASNLFEELLSCVSMTFQNIDSVELSISDVDHYYEYLGGLSNAVRKRSGNRPAMLLVESYGPGGVEGAKVRSLEEKIRVESRTRLLNPKWYEGLIAHGYQGVAEIASRVDNTFGWAATVQAVDGWIFDATADTYLLDEMMRERLAQLNPQAAYHMTGRLLEAQGRGLWNADDLRLEQLRSIYDSLEDIIELI